MKGRPAKKKAPREKCEDLETEYNGIQLGGDVAPNIDQACILAGVEGAAQRASRIIEEVAQAHPQNLGQLQKLLWGNPGFTFLVGGELLFGHSARITQLLRRHSELPAPSRDLRADDYIRT